MSWSRSPPEASPRRAPRRGVRLHNGAYYEAGVGEDGEASFVVVESPTGAIVPTLPDGAEQKSIGGADYFVYAGTYYQPFYSGSNVVYLVVKDPTG
jgi:hypothetical protein